MSFIPSPLSCSYSLSYIASMIILLFYLSILPTNSCLEFRIGPRTVMEVASANGTFSPLCASAVNDEYLRKVCGLDSSAAAPVSSTSSVPSISSPTLSIACVQDGSCFTFQSPFCRQIVKVNCPNAPAGTRVVARSCMPGDLLVGKKCIRIGIKAFGSYGEAKDSCPVRVASFPVEADRVTVAAAVRANQGLSSSDASLPSFTSGFRRGSQWMWEDGTEIEMKVEGDGRCLAYWKDGWRGVDCEGRGTVMCETGTECRGAERYEGRRNETAEGLPCMKWNDPSIIFYGSVVEGQSSWNHNYCRVVDTSSPVECFVAPNKLSPCDVPRCEDHFEMRDVALTEGCGSSEWRCDDGSCIPDEFRCDFEKDCADGSDEQRCQDYLQSFELIGPLKLVDKVTEIWTYIPHVQGCARRCQESHLVCEAFSYEPRSQTCLLTDSTLTINLTPKTSSQYYRRRLSPKDVEFSLDNGLLLASRNGSRHPICDDNFTHDYASAICEIAGFGRAFVAAAVEGNETRKRERPTSAGWTVECLTRQECTSTQICNHVRCSLCKEAVCDDGGCVDRDRLCDGKRDCKDGSDEGRCDDISFRLSNGSESSGVVEVFYSGGWQPVCSEGIDDQAATAICSATSMNGPASSLSPIHLFRPGRGLICRDGHCRLSSIRSCSTQARIRCNPVVINSGSSCGLRKVDVSARDPSRLRLARVVGGFETAAGAFPWTAAIKLKSTGVHHCGASILDETHLITAAHCFEDDRRPLSYSIIAGDWDNNITEGTEQVVTPTRFFFYPLYEDLFSHDVCIIEISSPGFEWTDWVQPICLPERDFNYHSGTACVVSGWGSLGLEYPHRLQAAVLPIIDPSACRASSKIYESMSRSAFCAGYLDGGVDSCQGDSGGPYACQDKDGRFVLAGVISWGDGCAQKSQPGIYTMVAPYLNWIHDTVTRS